MPCKYNTYIFFLSMAQCHADATHEGSRISSMLCKYTIWKFPNYSSVPRQCNMKDPQSARCHASATHEGSQMSSVPCQRNTWRFPNELSAMPAQYMKAPEQARCHISAIHEGSRTSSETQKLLVQALEETVRNVKFFLKANSVIEEQKSTVRFAGACSWSDCISSPNISSFVGHGLMNGAVAPCSAFTSRVKVRMYMSLCLHVIAGFTHTYGYMDMFFHCASLLVGRGLALSTTAFWASCTRWPTTMPSQSFPGVKVLGLFAGCGGLI